MATLVVGLDHVATLRQAGGGRDPDPVVAAALAELGGADGIRVTCGRERAGIQERDAHLLHEVVRSAFVLRMPPADDYLKLALAIRPNMVVLIPGEREGLGGERGLDVEDRRAELLPFVETLKGSEILVALAVDPVATQVKAVQRAGAGAVLLHTGRFAWAATAATRSAELEALTNAVKVAHRLGLVVHVGGGLSHASARAVADLPEIAAADVGHAVVARATLIGMEAAAREMRQVVQGPTR